MNSPRYVTLVVCTHNRAELLRQAVNQLLRQDYPEDHFEVLIVDNASTDHTAQVAKQLVGDNQGRVRYVLEKRSGVTFARNRGAEEARFPYVAYCDDDCTIEPDWLDHLLTGFDLDHEVVGVGGLVLLNWNQGSPRWLSPDLEPYMGSTSYLGMAPRVLSGTERVVEYNFVLKRSAWLVSGGFFGMEQLGCEHLSAAEGLLLLRRLRASGGKIAYVPQAVMYHCVQGRTTRQWMLRRSYWQGISDALLDGLLRQKAVNETIHIVGSNMRSAVLCGLRASLAYVSGQPAEVMRQLSFGAAHLGRVFGELHLEGDWERVTAMRSQYQINARSMIT